MNYNILILILIVFAFSSCAKTEQTNWTVQNRVEIRPEDETLQLSSLFKNYRIIPLQGEPLDAVVDVAVADSLLVVGGKSENSSIHLYDINGEYKNALVSAGRGPNEAFIIQSFKVVDSVTVEIPISSSGKYVSRSNYSWSLSSGDPITDLTDRSDVLDRKSLKCRFPVPETHGRYTITYKANYVVSGQAQSSSWSKALSSGGRVSYTLAQLYGNITITQEIEVERAD